MSLLAYLHHSRILPLYTPGPKCEHTLLESGREKVNKFVSLIQKSINILTNFVTKHLFRRALQSNVKATVAVTILMTCHYKSKEYFPDFILPQQTPAKPELACSHKELQSSLGCLDLLPNTWRRTNTQVRDSMWTLIIIRPSIFYLMTHYRWK